MAGVPTVNVCQGCEYAGEQVSVSYGNMASDISIGPDGTIWYAGADYSECGIGAGWVGPEDAWAERPEMAERINSCQEPVSEVIDVPVRWPLGLLGLTKPVEVRRCPAIEASSLKEIVKAQVALHQA